MHLLACLGMVLSVLEEVSCACPSQCTCGYHSSSDGVGSRYAPLPATKCSNDSEKKDSASSFILKANCRSEMKEGLIDIRFNLIILILCVSSIVFILGSSALKSSSNHLRLSNTFWVTEMFIALVFTNAPFRRSSWNVRGQLSLTVESRADQQVPDMPGSFASQVFHFIWGLFTATG